MRDDVHSFHRRARHLVLCLALLWPGVLAQAGGPALAAPPADPGSTGIESPNARPLADLLNPDGTLDLGTGFQGSLDPSGWRLVSSAGEPPRFAPAHASSQALPSAAASVAGDELWSDEFATNGVDSWVKAVAVSGGKVYIGGAFTSPGNHIVCWDGTHWCGLGSGLGGEVFALAISSGYVYAGGRFDNAGSLAVSNIALWDGGGWYALGSGVNGTVNALAADGAGNVYAGGSFRYLGDGMEVNSIARWNESDFSWHAVGSGVDYTINAMAWGVSWLCVGGNFHHAGSLPVTHVATCNATTWGMAGAGLTDTVKALTYDPVNSRFYAGTGDYLVPGRVWWMSAFGGAWYPLGDAFNERVEKVGVDASGNVYAGGQFTVSGSGLAVYSGGSWLPVGAGTGGSVHAIAASGNNLYAGGFFTQAGGVLANHIARWDIAGSSWSPLIGGGPDNTVNAVAVNATAVYVGGLFQSAGGVGASYVAWWDGARWRALGTGMNGQVLALAIDGSNRLYAGGAFTTAGGGSASHVARWTGSTWVALGLGTNGNVQALAAYGSDLYAGGDFTMAGGSPANHIARWSGSVWSALGSGLTHTVGALAVDSAGALYAACYYRVVTGAAGVEPQAPPGNPFGDVYVWTAGAWQQLGTSMNDYVQDLAVDENGHLYAGGDFSTAGGSSVAHIALWTGSAWQGLGSGTNGSVFALAVGGDGALYAGGSFSSAGGVAAANVARWDGVHWSALGGGTDNRVLALAADDGCSLYAGGQFLTAGGKVSRQVARRYLMCYACHLPLVLR